MLKRKSVKRKMKEKRRKKGKATSMSQALYKFMHGTADNSALAQGSARLLD